ncbi:MAG: class I SAM-dependent methyltransferase [Pseudomonadota bacterium]
MNEAELSTSLGMNTEGVNIYNCYVNSRYLSIKHSSYFQVYQDLLEEYRGKEIVFVEIGVLNGGSLFMWRDYLGPKARIIGVDLNPLAKKWESSGFEIFIGSQADVDFWHNLFKAIGSVDVILDDGGHTNEQQIVTASVCIPYIRDGGLLIVEDTHSSYMNDFGNPSKYSFMNFVKRLMDGVNSRFPAVHDLRHTLSALVYSIGIFESIVCFKIDRNKCFMSAPTSNGGISSDAADFRYHNSRAMRLNDFLTFQLKRIGIRFSAKTFFSKIDQKLIGIKLRRYF